MREHRDVSKTIQVSLFGPSPIRMASPHKAVLTILDNDPVTPHDPQNPLELPSAPGAANPLVGASFFVDPHSEVANAARRYPALKTISSQPGAARFGSFSFGHNGVPNIATAVSRYLTRALVEEPGTVPLLATYRVVHRLCGHASDSRADIASYEGFTDGFAKGIGSYRAVLFLEMDSIITMGCLSRHGQTVREHELQYAINTLTANCPHLVIYLDAGAADALPARLAARYLLRSGLGCTRPARAARLARGNEVLCNPPGRGLGSRPTADTGFPMSGGRRGPRPLVPRVSTCSRGRPTVFWPAYALMLVRNADFNSR